MESAIRARSLWQVGEDYPDFANLVEFGFCASSHNKRD
jgi:hypothetical protein